MKKILHNVRSKSPEFKLGLSIVMAFVATALIVGAYAMILSASRPDDSVRNDAPSPIDALVGSIKSMQNPSKSVQVIDASQNGENVPASSADGSNQNQ